MAAETNPALSAGAVPGNLQWSRRRMAAETLIGESTVRRLLHLQWSRRRMAAETSAMLSAAFALPAAFNGAAAGWRRKPSDDVGRLKQRRPFNGAAAGWR